MAVFSGNGSAGSPSFTFSSDTDSGIFRGAANTVSISAAGEKITDFFSDGSGDNKQIIFSGDLDNTSASTSQVMLRLSDRDSAYDGVESSGDWRSSIQFIATQINGSQRDGSRIEQAVTYNNFGGGGVNIKTDLIFKTRGDAEGSGDDASEKVRITHAGDINANGSLLINSGGDVKIGGTLPSAPNITLASSGTINAAGRVFSAPTIGHAISSQQVSSQDVTDRVNASWLSASARGSWVRASDTFFNGDQRQLVTFKNGSNTDYIVWDLLLHNCESIVCVLTYSNYVDGTSRSISSEYSLDGGSTWTALGSVTVGAGNGINFGGTITFASGTSARTRYLKVRAFYTSGAITSDLVGISSVNFTPSCTSVQVVNSLNTP